MRTSTYLRLLPAVALVSAISIMTGCSQSTSSRGTLLAVGLQSGAPGSKGVIQGNPSDPIWQITLTRATVVFGHIELQGEVDTVVYRTEAHAPLVVDLDLNGGTQSLAIAPISSGRFNSAVMRIHKLEEDDSKVWSANPDLRDLSIRVEGFFNGDSSQTFLFTSELDEMQGREFEEVTVLENGFTQVTFHLDYDQWFRDDAASLVNPDNGQLSAWRPTIEDNIMASFGVY